MTLFMERIKKSGADGFRIFLTQFSTNDLFMIITLYKDVSRKWSECIEVVKGLKRSNEIEWYSIRPRHRYVFTFFHAVALSSLNRDPNV